MPDKKEMTKEEKIEKAKELMKEMEELELSEEELVQICGGHQCHSFKDICRLQNEWCILE